MPSHRRPTRARRTVAALGTAAMIGAGSAIAFAAPATAEPVRVGPGGSIRIPETGSPVQDGRHVKAPMCSSSVPGTVTDANGEKHRVMLTAGHCVTEELPGTNGNDGVIYAPTREGDVRIGTVGPNAFSVPSDDEALANPVIIANGMFNGPDWAFIELDDDVETTGASQAYDENGQNAGEPVQMTGVVDYEDLGPAEISVDNFGRRACTDGTRTGRQCGYQVFRGQNGVWIVLIQLDNGDSGGNAYDPDTGEVIGTNSMSVGPFNRVQPADVALQEAYGIEDGKVNEHFEIEQSSEPQTEYRTISEDMEHSRRWKAENEPEEPTLYDQIRDVVPGLPEENPIPLPMP